MYCPELLILTPVRIPKNCANSVLEDYPVLPQWVRSFQGKMVSIDTGSAWLRDEGLAIIPAQFWHRTMLTRWEYGNLLAVSRIAVLDESGMSFLTLRGGRSYLEPKPVGAKSSRRSHFF